MRCKMLEHPEQKLARFLGGLKPEIANVVELQPFWTFEDVCKLAFKVEKQRKHYKPTGSKPFTRSMSSSKGYSLTKPEATMKDRGKTKVDDPLKEKSNPTRSDKKCFKCHGYGHFQAEYPNKRVVTLKEIEEIEAASQEEEYEV
ncbi:hypothetical protein CFOL_v3_01978 [Cephalotus follicularis]|uniref:CCHC-type domain-containing protein n=1 Tax=Cephalotus follicularis TaxID=3775 RepID=A0A1Q3ARZ7_CEPFO|nr:hypothetical protein CFOL_v3_01978 [Cephalotus follicularis]